MNKKQLMAVWVVGIFLLSGCAITRVQKEKLDTLTLGLNKSEIKEKVGKPSLLIECNEWEDSSSKGKTRKVDIPLEIWEYYVSGEEKSTLLYVYKDQLVQIEEMDRHIYMPDKEKILNVIDAFPPFKFKIDKEDLEKIRKK